MTTGAQAWAKQQPLADRFELVVPELFTPGDVSRSDFEHDARLIEPLLSDGAHLVGHSYGGVVAIFAAANVPSLVRSLTVIEAPAHGLLRGDPDVEVELDAYDERLRTLHEPEAFVRAFFASIGVDTEAMPSPFPPPLDEMARRLMLQRLPWDTPWPVETVRDAAFRKLVLSGGHHPVLERVCDELASRIHGSRKVIAGRGHLVQRADGFNAVLEGFVSEAEIAG
jgi:pimeloyl-ACP methyl ester carboxylesterase